MYAVDRLRLADCIGATCCVNIVGTPHGAIDLVHYALRLDQQLNIQIIILYTKEPC